MITRTKGVVLSHFPYKESSIICKIFTEEFGTRSFLVHNVRSKKNSHNGIFLQPLTLVDLDVYINTKGSLHRIKEHRVTVPFHSIPFQQSKRAITFFLTEVFVRCLREEHANRDLFAFISHAIEVFDSQKEHTENFHLFILFFMAKYLGFYPHDANTPQDIYFDLKDGKYLNYKPSHPHYLSLEETNLWRDVTSRPQDLLLEFKLSRTERNLLIDKVLEYYALHIPDFGELKSLDVLKHLFI